MLCVYFDFDCGLCYAPFLYVVDGCFGLAQLIVMGLIKVGCFLLVCFASSWRCELLLNLLCVLLCIFLILSLRGCFALLVLTGVITLGYYRCGGCFAVCCLIVGLHVLRFGLGLLAGFV